MNILPPPIELHLLPSIGAFIILIVPFYHGAMRHLYATYVEHGGSQNIKSRGLLLDFFLLFVEGCLFLLMASVIANPTAFLWSALALLAVDCVWGVVAWLLLTGAKSQFAEKEWARINAGAVAIIWTFLHFCPARLPADGEQVAWIALLVLGARTFIDYWRTWNFYFPGDDQVRNVAGTKR